MDNFEHLASGLESPAFNANAIMPDDVLTLPNATRAVWIGGVGDLHVKMLSGNEVVFKNASGWMPIRISQVKQSDTTATDIVGVW